MAAVPENAKCSGYVGRVFDASRSACSDWRCRGNLNQLGIYVFWLVKKCLVNVLGIPVGTLRGLDSDGRCCWSYAP